MADDNLAGFFEQMRKTMTNGATYDLSATIAATTKGIEFENFSLKKKASRKRTRGPKKEKAAAADTDTKTSL